MKRKSIIIIDDHPLLRDAWSFILESTNRYAIKGKFSKSEELADIIREKKPDIVILDISIKQLYEFPIIKLIRKFSPLSKIIAISLHLGHTYAKKILQAGAKGFLNKNCPASELLEAVDVVLKGEIYVCEDAKHDNPKNLSKYSAENVAGLTKRELEIIQLVRHGFSSKQIATKIAIAPQTVDTHRRNILKKLNVKNSTALLQFVHAYGL